MTVLEKILPKYIIAMFSKLNLEKLYEIRLRSRAPLLINYGGDYKYIGTSGVISDTPDGAFIIGQEIPQIVLARACEFSLYAHNNRLKDGYVSLEGGIRIGVAGETVYEGNEVKTIKNVTSVNIRLPHHIAGCSDKIFRFLFDEQNTPLGALIISPPGAGKTTMLRDISRNFSTCKKVYNVAIADERCEIAAVNFGIAQLDVGFNTDIISACKKKYAFECAVRTLTPDVLITDEIATSDDLSACIEAAGSGVAVIASAHAKDVEELRQKLRFREYMDFAFKRFVILSCRCGKGTIEQVCDAEGRIYYEAKK